MRDVVPAALAGERVDKVVALLTGLARADVARLVEEGGVRVGGRPVASRSRRLVEGDELEVDVPEARPAAGVAPDPSVEVAVVYADDALAVVDKAAGVVVHPGAGRAGGTLAAGLLARWPELAGVGERDRPGIVHRLDKGTSGLMLVARTAEAHRALSAQLERREVERRYLALVWEAVEAPAGLVDAPVGRAERDPTRMSVSAAGRPARTRYDVRRRFAQPAPATLVECRLETGRTHQIRVHLAAIGHPVLGDARYGGARSTALSPRPFLHAHRLAFDHPASGERLAFSSELPADLVAVLARFR
ncbi:MAG TPA: RluA family pseudouridine synthase [Acidimicrobiales bacterium]|nr:RluA family pseudouridine synthase [Acidimicrobiales bacterium]